MEFEERPVNKNSLTQRKLVFGVGVNDSKYLTSWVNGEGKEVKCPYYSRWRSLIGRCYGKSKSTLKNYQDCLVHPHWLIFSNFRLWMKERDWRGMHLDKDLKVLGNRTYGPDTCTFVPQKVNNLFIRNKPDSRDLPTGVNRVGESAKYVSSIVENSKRIHLGVFDTPEEAYKIYLKSKIVYSREIAWEYWDNSELFDLIVLNINRLQGELNEINNKLP